MKAKTVTRFVLAALAVLLVSSSTSPLRAFHSEVMTYYYTGCDSSLTLVGSSYLSCDWQMTRDGQQGGWFMEQYETDCDTGYPEHNVYEYCSGTWRPATLGDCGCSH